MRDCPPRLETAPSLPHHAIDPNIPTLKVVECLRGT